MFLRILDKIILYCPLTSTLYDSVYAFFLAIILHRLDHNTSVRHTFHNIILASSVWTFEFKSQRSQVFFMSLLNVEWNFVSLPHTKAAPFSFGDYFISGIAFMWYARCWVYQRFNGRPICVRFKTLRIALKTFHNLNPNPKHLQQLPSALPTLQIPEASQWSHGSLINLSREIWSFFMSWIITYL